MDELHRRIRNCFSQTLRERGIEPAHYVSARPYDRFLAAVIDSGPTDPKAIAALALSVLCDGNSANLDAIALISVGVFLEKNMRRNVEHDRENILYELAQAVPACQADFRKLIERYYY